MDISKEDFDRVKRILGKVSKVQNQEQVLKEIGFEIESDCDNYIGKYFPDEEWKKPDPDLVYEFFERTLSDHESRYQKFLKSPMLSLDELESFKGLRKTEYEDNEGYPSIWTGSIKYQESELIIFTSRWNSDDTQILGIFETYDEGELSLFSDGEII